MIDTRQNRRAGTSFRPPGFPARVAIEGDTVYVANARRTRHRPQCAKRFRQWTLLRQLRQAASQFSPCRSGGRSAGPHQRGDGRQWLPPAPRRQPAAARRHPARGPDRQGKPHLRRGVRRYRERLQRPRHERAGAGAVRQHGYVDGQGSRLSLQRCRSHAEPSRAGQPMGFSDNFYADSDVSVDGHHWLVGSPPNAWTETSFSRLLHR